MSKTKKLPVRLAMRAEGEWWVAYLAQENTMENAKPLGQIRLGIVESNQERKQAFMALMQNAVSDAISDIFKQTPEWGEPRSAPEAERAGRA